MLKIVAERILTAGERTQSLHGWIFFRIWTRGIKSDEPQPNYWSASISAVGLGLDVRAATAVRQQMTNVMSQRQAELALAWEGPPFDRLKSSRENDAIENKPMLQSRGGQRVYRNAQSPQTNPERQTFLKTLVQLRTYRTRLRVARIA